MSHISANKMVSSSYPEVSEERSDVSDENVDSAASGGSRLTLKDTIRKTVRSYNGSVLLD